MRQRKKQTKTREMEKKKIETTRRSMRFHGHFVWFYPFTVIGWEQEAIRI